jgi:hypothetical protein
LASCDDKIKRQRIKEKEMERTRFSAVVLIIAVLCISTVQAAPISVTYTINTDANRTPISQYVYGSNWGGGTDYTIRRSGGNRLTAYNWENNYSNAGADWYFFNDNSMSSSLVPGQAIVDFHNTALSQGQASIVTLQMAGYVSADGNHEVNLVTEAAPSPRFKKVVFAKGAPFCSPPGSPNTTDANVYMDEFINFLVSTYGHAGTANGVKFYDLDNEPDIWSDGNKGATHPEVHPLDPCCAEYKDKSVSLSIAVKNVDPNAQIMGPVSYGFSGYLNFQGASDWKAPLSTGYSWFLSYYLHKMGIDSNTAGKRLLDALDVHWYPEATDGANHRILDNTINTPAMYNARMQAPRTLWDTGYIYPNITYPNGEVSWINQQWNAQYLPLITRLKNDIKTYYPDTNLAITEYDYGGQDHYTGGIATSDVLGIFGKYGIYIATYWGDGSYVRAAFKLYRNYNGWDFTFGDTNVPAVMSDKANSSIYGSIFENDTNELHLIVLNKNIDNAINGTFNITSTKSYTIGRVWAFDANSSNITPLPGTISVSGNSFSYSIPPKTACHIVLWEACPYQYDITGDCRADLADLDKIADAWLQSRDCASDPNCPDINNNHIVDFADIVLLGQEWRM